LKHIALLRGINVGGKNMVAMADLVALFSAAGCTRVRTYIQSGNVVFEASAATAAKAARTVHEKVGVPVVLRTGEAVLRALDRNPYPGKEAALHLMFLGEAPSKQALSALDPLRSPGDVYTVSGADIYLHLPNGVARTKLTNAYFDRVLATVSTLRNWRTVEKLAAM
jgi:uncharacterized protein (DUF1697 family)